MKRGFGTGACSVRRRGGSGGTREKPPGSAWMSVRRWSHDERWEAERQQEQINTRGVQRGYEENLSSHECCQEEQVVLRGYAISIHVRVDWINP